MLDVLKSNYPQDLHYQGNFQYCQGTENKVTERNNINSAKNVNSECIIFILTSCSLNILVTHYRKRLCQVSMRITLSEKIILSISENRSPNCTVLE